MNLPTRFTVANTADFSLFQRMFDALVPEALAKFRDNKALDNMGPFKSFTFFCEVFRDEVKAR